MSAVARPEGDSTLVTAEFPGPTADGNVAMLASRSEDSVALDTALN